MYIHVYTQILPREIILYQLFYFSFEALVKKRIKYGVRDHRGVLCQPPSQPWRRHLKLVVLCVPPAKTSKNPCVATNTQQQQHYNRNVNRLLINHWFFWAPYFWDLLLPWSTEVADANGHAGLVFGATVTNSALVETHKLKQVMFEKSETIGRILAQWVIDLWQDNDCQGQRTINNDKSAIVTLCSCCEICENTEVPETL